MTTISGDQHPAVRCRSCERFPTLQCRCTENDLRVQLTKAVDGRNEWKARAESRAKVIDDQPNALTLRLRELGGLIRVAGDLATVQGANHISAKHVKEARRRALPVEAQIKERHGTYRRGLASDVTSAQKEAAPYNYWNYTSDDDGTGYG